MSTLQKIEEWYARWCDGDWEHEFGLTITTLDNPGWRIEIDLNDTELDGAELEMQSVGNDEDWWRIRIIDNKFIASGDPGKFEFLLGKFLLFADTKDPSVLKTETLI